VNINDMVIISECHSIPELVGKKAIVVQIDKAKDKYPILVKTTEEIEIKITVPGIGIVIAKADGPFPFREDELELVTQTKTSIPDDILKAFDEDTESDSPGQAS